MYCNCELLVERDITSLSHVTCKNLYKKIVKCRLKRLEERNIFQDFYIFTVFFYKFLKVRRM